jgi:hypothetical protein
MTTLAVTFYDVVKWVHISAVVVGFGSTFAYAVILAVVGRENPRAMPALLRGIAANDRTLVTIGAALVLLTGIYLTADRWDFSDFYIGWGILAVLVLLGLTHGYFLRTEERARKLAERDIERAGDGPVEFSPEYEQASGGLAKVGTLAGLIVVLTVYVMTAKPFL